MQQGEPHMGTLYPTRDFSLIPDCAGIAQAAIQIAINEAGAELLFGLLMHSLSTALSQIKRSDDWTRFSLIVYLCRLPRLSKPFKPEARSPEPHYPKASTFVSLNPGPWHPAQTWNLNSPSSVYTDNTDTSS